MYVLLTFSHLLVPRLCVPPPHHLCLYCSLFLTFSSLVCACFSPSPVFVWLTFSHLFVSSLYVLFPHRPCLVGSLFLAFLSLGSVCFSPIIHVCLAHFFLPSCLQHVHACPPSPMFVLHTFSHLLVLRGCVLFPYRPCFSCSLFLTFLSPACACFSPIAHVFPVHCFSPPRL
jgi:hypothetical protein